MEIEEIKKKGFFKEYRFLSNFHLVEIEDEGLIYPSTENYYQAMKSDVMTIRNIFTKITPQESKVLGRIIDLRKHWETMKHTFMEKANNIKFSNPELKQKLLDTGDKLLVEYNYWHDNYWGYCLCNECEGKEHKNELGKILMEIRSKI